VPNSSRNNTVYASQLELGPYPSERYGARGFEHVHVGQAQRYTTM
jgi:hypothetical protein